MELFDFFSEFVCPIELFLLSREGALVDEFLDEVVTFWGDLWLCRESEEGCTKEELSA